jgi:eukaryotic-like serine/threonine-protein kinase
MENPLLATTVPFNANQSADQHEFEFHGDLAPQSRLLTYHDRFGHPLLPFVPDAPPTELCWDTRYEVIKQLGQGAQGVVYLARREGVDGYHSNVALKMFYRRPNCTYEEYVAEMRHVAQQTLLISQIQHDNLISIQNFIAMDDTRVLVMESVDGLDLARLLELKLLEDLRSSLDKKTWEHLSDVIVTPGEDHCRLKPGIAVDILRGCLAGLSSLHHEKIVHCDLKPANIMVKRSGTKKIVDVDSSCVISDGTTQSRGTPYYMAPEQMRNKPVRLASDVAALGYVLIELLTGRKIFRECHTFDQLLEAKLALPKRLSHLLPAEVRRDEILYDLVHKMVAIDPNDRFPNADAVDLDHKGAANFHRHLVKSDLSTEYRRELAWWLELINNSSVAG